MAFLPAMSIVSAVGTGLSVISSIQSGKAEAKAAQYNAESARREAQAR